MNIFVLDLSPTIAATFHCDKHVVKMIVEYAQLLSTAHRVLDGTVHYVELSAKNGAAKKRAVFLLDGEKASVKTRAVNDAVKQVIEIENARCYKATHAQHPCAIWARANRANYLWLVQLLTALCAEYTFRYGKKHACEQLLPFFNSPPQNIKDGALTVFAQAMPKQFMEPSDAVLAYRCFYLGEKIRFAKWTRRSIPDWFITQATSQGLNVTNFTRTITAGRGQTISA